MKTKLSYDYEHYASTAELPEADRTLVAEACLLYTSDAADE